MKNELDLITKDSDIADIEKEPNKNTKSNDNIEIPEAIENDILDEVIEEEYVAPVLISIEEEIIDDYRENNYTLSEVNDEDLEEIKDKAEELEPKEDTKELSENKADETLEEELSEEEREMYDS